MNTLQTELQTRTAAFVADVTRLARRAALETLSAGLATTTGPARYTAPTRPAAPHVHHPKAAVDQVHPARGQKRTPAELDAVRARVAAHISAQPGQRIEQINAALGTKTKDVVGPVKALVAAGAVRTEGVRRATKYFPAANGKKTSAK